MIVQLRSLLLLRMPFLSARRTQLQLLLQLRISQILLRLARAPQRSCRALVLACLALLPRYASLFLSQIVLLCII
jgi:hypothetical protein